MLLVSKKVVLFWIQKASVNMTARFSVKNSLIEDDLILVLKKQTPTVKVITVRLKSRNQGRIQGRNQGRNQGTREESRKDGRNQGRKEGRKEGGRAEY
jgi:hypothetical protein